MAGFTRLVHADWSIAAKGRWLARASLQDGRWRAEAPEPVPPLDRFVAELFGGREPPLAGFDFPIGLPERIGLAGAWATFPEALAALPPAFFAVAERPDEIGPDRPFYPARPGGTSHAQLLAAHGVIRIAELMRRCERAAPGRRAAGCMLWTLGAAQVGRAALNGWAGVVRPARSRGAKLWPFHGSLEALGSSGLPVLAETYPADGYARLGAPFGPGQSKRRRADRATKAPALRAWARASDVDLAPALAAGLDDGFGEQDRGGDRFDAVIGLLAMIDDLRRGPTEPPADPAVRRWEGWIMGRDG